MSTRSNMILQLVARLRAEQQAQSEPQPQSQKSTSSALLPTIMTTHLPHAFTLTTSPTGAFALVLPANPPSLEPIHLIEHGTINLASPATRVYEYQPYPTKDFNTAPPATATMTQNGKTLLLEDGEREKVEKMVRNMIRGLDIAQMEAVLATTVEVSREEKARERLDKKAGFWRRCSDGLGEETGEMWKKLSWGMIQCDVAVRSRCWFRESMKNSSSLICIEHNLSSSSFQINTLSSKDLDVDNVSRWIGLMAAQVSCMGLYVSKLWKIQHDVSKNWKVLFLSFFTPFLKSSSHRTSHNHINCIASYPLYRVSLGDGSDHLCWSQHSRRPLLA